MTGMTTRGMTNGLLGFFNGDRYCLSPDLTLREEINVTSKLIDAKSKGFDSGIVTKSGTYATKKLTP